MESAPACRLRVEAAERSRYLPDVGEKLAKRQESQEEV